LRPDSQCVNVFEKREKSHTRLTRVVNKDRRIPKKFEYKSETNWLEATSIRESSRMRFSCYFKSFSVAICLGMANSRHISGFLEEPGMGHTLAYSAQFHEIRVYGPSVVHLAPRNRGYEPPQVVEQVGGALGSMGMCRKFMEPHLLVININTIRPVLAGTREFLVVRVRALFS
jgi:hypothetical protein